MEACALPGTRVLGSLHQCWGWRPGRAEGPLLNALGRWSPGDFRPSPQLPVAGLPSVGGGEPACGG